MRGVKSSLAYFLLLSLIEKSVRLFLLNTTPSRAEASRKYNGEVTQSQMSPLRGSIAFKNQGLHYDIPSGFDVNKKQVLILS
jgi:hypothetical protein